MNKRITREKTYLFLVFKFQYKTLSLNWGEGSNQGYSRGGGQNQGVLTLFHTGGQIFCYRQFFATAQKRLVLDC